MPPENFSQVLLVFPLQASAVSTPSKIDSTLFHFNSFTLSMVLQWVVTSITSLYTPFAKISNMPLPKSLLSCFSGMAQGMSSLLLLSWATMVASSGGTAWSTLSLCCCVIDRLVVVRRLSKNFVCDHVTLKLMHHMFYILLLLSTHHISKLPLHCWALLYL